MKILNLYAGIGGNRKLWGDEHQVTAVQHKKQIADAYKDLFPNDTVIIGDAHKYLLEHYEEFDFIWSSPPCPTHSKMNDVLHSQGIRRFPDMNLYQEIIYLKHRFKGKWVVENVMSYKEYDDSLESYLDIHLKSEIKGKRLFLRNCVYPPLGQHILNCAKGNPLAL